MELPACADHVARRRMRGGLGPWFSAMAANAAIALCIGTMMRLVRVTSLLLVHLPKRRAALASDRSIYVRIAASRHEYCRERESHRRQHDLE